VAAVLATIPRLRTALVTALSMTTTLTLIAGCASNGLDEAAEQSADRPTSAPPSAPAGPAESLGGWVAPGLDWTTCDDNDAFDCTMLEVPLDWDDLAGEQIELAVARHPADGDRIGMLVSNPGGPGASGLDYVFAEPFDESVSERFDLVSWDPRGVGRSTAFDCDDQVDEFLANDPDPDTPAEQTAIDSDAKAVADDCAANSPGLAANVGTDDVARDLEAIRVALGDEPLTYMGFSYGTLIGLRYLDLFPTKVRAIVLDGVVDPTLGFEAWLEQQTVAIDASVSRAFEACDDDPDCPVDDLAATYDKVQAMVEEEPIPAGTEELGPAQLQTGAVYVSYEQLLWPDLADALADAADGDGRAMLNLAKGYYDFGGYTAYAAVECLDSPVPVGSEAFRAFADRLRAISPRIGGSVANELLPCAYWPAPTGSIVGPVVAEGAPPVLVLGNRGDAATPYANSQRVADTLADGHLVSFDGEGHTSYGRSACVNKAVNAYLIDLDVPRSDPDCR